MTNATWVGADMPLAFGPVWPKTPYQHVTSVNRAWMCRIEEHEHDPIGDAYCGWLDTWREDHHCADNPLGMFCCGARWLDRADKLNAIDSWTLRNPERFPTDPQMDPSWLLFG